MDIKLSDIWSRLTNVKNVTVWKQPKIKVDLNQKENYMFHSVSSIYAKSGLHVYVTEI